jgi:hypothetical protein
MADICFKLPNGKLGLSCHKRKSLEVEFAVILSRSTLTGAVRPRLHGLTAYVSKVLLGFLLGLFQLR